MNFTWQDVVTVTQTIWAESRGEPQMGKWAVAQVIKNRAIKRKMTPATICLQKWQFSCWNMNDPNYKIISEPNKDISGKDWDACLDAFRSVFWLNVPDITNGATHYHTQAIKPNWAVGKEPCYVFGNHIFYNNID